MPEKARTTGRWVVYFQLAVALIAFAVIVYALLRPDNTDNSQASVAEPLVVGYQTSPAMALIIIADARGYFPGVKLREFSAGKLALQAFLGGSLDVAVAGDVPIGLALLQGQRLTAFSEVLRGSRDEVRMVVRHPGGCEGLTALTYFMGGEKKRIGTSFGGGPEYFTISFLDAVSVPRSRVQLLPYNPPEMAAAIESGAVDGVAIFDPAASKIERLLGADGCTFPDPGVYRQHYVAVARPDLTSPLDPRLDAFVAGLRRAEAFVRDRPEEAQAIVAAKTSIDSDTIAALWPKLSFGVALDRELPRLWMRQADVWRAKPDAAFPADATPDYAGAIISAELDPTRTRGLAATATLPR